MLLEQDQGRPKRENYFICSRKQIFLFVLLLVYPQNHCIEYNGRFPFGIQNERYSRRIENSTTIFQHNTCGKMKCLKENIIRLVCGKEKHVNGVKRKQFHASAQYNS